MGLIHSRASKQRNKQEAKLLKQRRHLEADEAAEEMPWYRQRTLGAALGQALRQSRDQQESQGGSP